jgi:hypothetical protein
MACDDHLAPARASARPGDFRALFPSAGRSPILVADAGEAAADVRRLHGPATGMKSPVLYVARAA